jgi:hypothetical protein
LLNENEPSVNVLEPVVVLFKKTLASETEFSLAALITFPVMLFWANDESGIKSNKIQNLSIFGQWSVLPPHRSIILGR